jgi:SAM-dependent methyltransferase
MTIEFETVDCTSCGSNKSTLVYALQDYLYGLAGDFACRRCETCGLLYLSPRPTRAAIVDFYPATYQPYRTAIQDETNSLMRYMRRRKVIRRRQAVEKHVAQGPRNLLDVGCSTGIFMDEMRRAGWEVSGIEINDDTVAYARQRFHLTVTCGDLLETDLPLAAFDLITLWDVLEHTFDARAVLVKANQLLRPGGILALTLPNWESLDRRLFGRYWIGFDAPRHLHVFPNAVLQDLLGQTGFAVVENKCQFGGYFTFITSVRTWLHTRAQTRLWPTLVEKLIDIHGIRLLFEPFFMLMDQAGLGGIRFVVARKILPK